MKRNAEVVSENFVSSNSISRSPVQSPLNLALELGEPIHYVMDTLFN
jgi:hypothetical protein